MELRLRKYIELLTGLRGRCDCTSRAKSDIYDCLVVQLKCDWLGKYALSPSLCMSSAATAVASSQLSFNSHMPFVSNCTSPFAGLSQFFCEILSLAIRGLGLIHCTWPNWRSLLLLCLLLESCNLSTSHVPSYRKRWLVRIRQMTDLIPKQGWRILKQAIIDFKEEI